MRSAKNHSAAFALTENADCAARNFHGVVVGYAFEILRRNQSNGADAKTEDAYAHASKLAHDVRLDAGFDCSAAHVVVGRDEIEVCKLHCSRKTFYAVIEIMISERPHVIANRGHGLVFDFAFIEIEVGRALKSIASVNQQCVRILSANAFDERCAARDSAFACVPVVRGKRVNLRVNVVSM